MHIRLQWYDTEEDEVYGFLLIYMASANNHLNNWVCSLAIYDIWPVSISSQASSG